MNTSNGEFSADGEDDHRLLMQFLSEHKDLIATFAKPRQEQPAPASNAATAVAGPPLTVDTRLEEAFRLHLDVERAARLEATTIHEKTVLFRDFIEVFGVIPLEWIAPVWVAAAVT